jgi:hypothetical protein
MGLNLINALSAASTKHRPTLRSVRRWSLRRALLVILAVSALGWGLIIALFYRVFS